MPRALFHPGYPTARNRLRIISNRLARSASSGPFAVMTSWIVSTARVRRLGSSGNIFGERAFRVGPRKHRLVSQDRIEPRQRNALILRRVIA